MSEPDDAAGSGKGRPTPKRKDARKQRRVPLDRKEAARVRRERSRELRLQQRAALQSGDERHLPPRDAGPAKRLARDVVDRRFTFGQVLYGLIIVVFLGTFLTQPASVPKGHKQPANVAGAALTLISILILVVVFIDAVRVGRKARREVTEKYGVKEAFGITGYATIRALQPRRFRRPPPRVTRGGNPVPPKKT